MLSGHHRERGFSLIELMVTVAVLSILLLVGIPAFSSWIANAQVRTVADGILNGLHLAQAEASRRNRKVQFTLGTSTTLPSWTLTTVPMTNLYAPGTTTAEVAETIQSASLGNVGSNVSVTVSPATAQTLTFNSYGYVVGATAITTYSITRSGADHPLKVTVSVGGQIRTCDPGLALSSSPEGCS